MWGMAIHNWSVRRRNLGWMCQEDNLGHKRNHLCRWDIFGISNNISTLDILHSEVTNIETDVVTFSCFNVSSFKTCQGCHVPQTASKIGLWCISIDLTSLTIPPGAIWILCPDFKVPLSTRPVTIVPTPSKETSQKHHFLPQMLIIYQELWIHLEPEFEEACHLVVKEFPTCQ